MTRNVDEHPNAKAYRRTADAFRAQDEEALRDLIADDVIWHVPGRNPMAGEVRGRDSLFDWFQRLRAATNGTASSRSAGSIPPTSMRGTECCPDPDGEGREHRRELPRVIFPSSRRHVETVDPDAGVGANQPPELRPVRVAKALT